MPTNPMSSWKFQCLSSNVASRAPCSSNLGIIQESMKTYIESIDDLVKGLQEKVESQQNKIQ